MACTSSPTAPSCATTSSSTPRRSTSSPPRTATGSACRPPPAEPLRHQPGAGLPRLRRCLKDTPSTAWRGSSRSCSPAARSTSPARRAGSRRAPPCSTAACWTRCSPTASTCSPASAATPCTCTSGLYGSYTSGTGAPPPARGALRMRWEGPRPRRRRRLDRPARPDRLRGAGRARGRPDPRAARPRPAAAPCRRRSARTGASRAAARAVGALLMDQTVLAGVGNVYRAELLFRHGVSPFRPGRGVEPDLWSRMWADLVTLMRSGVRMGRIVTTRPGGPDPPPRSRAARRRPLRLPPHRPAVPGLRHRGAHRGDGRPQPLLVPGLPGRLTRSPSSHLSHAAPDPRVPSGAMRNRLRSVLVVALAVAAAVLAVPGTASAAPDHGRVRRLLPAVRELAPQRPGLRRRRRQRRAVHQGQPVPEHPARLGVEVLRRRAGAAAGPGLPEHRQPRRGARPGHHVAEDRHARRYGTLRRQQLRGLLLPVRLGAGAATASPSFFTPGRAGRPRRHRPRRLHLVARRRDDEHLAVRLGRRRWRATARRWRG